MARESTEAIVKALRDAIHAESAFLAPHTSTLIEMAKLAIERLEQLQAENDRFEDRLFDLACDLSDRDA